MLDQYIGAAMENVAQEVGAHRGSLAALARKLSQVRDFGFTKDRLASAPSTLDELIGWLERGQHVVLEFGRYRRPLVYMLVANIITRRSFGGSAAASFPRASTRAPAIRPAAAGPTTMQRRTARSACAPYGQWLVDQVGCQNL